MQFSEGQNRPVEPAMLWMLFFLGIQIFGKVWMEPPPGLGWLTGSPELQPEKMPLPSRVISAAQFEPQFRELGDGRSFNKTCQNPIVIQRDFPAAAGGPEPGCCGRLPQVDTAHQEIPAADAGSHPNKLLVNSISCLW